MGKFSKVRRKGGNPSGKPCDETVKLENGLFEGKIIKLFNERSYNKNKRSIIFKRISQCTRRKEAKLKVRDYQKGSFVVDLG